MSIDREHENSLSHEEEILLEPSIQSPTSHSTHEDPESSHVLPQGRKNPSHNRQPPSRLLDYVTYNARYPFAKYLSYQMVASKHATFLNSISNASEPRSFQEAMQQDEWKKAMKEKLKALDDNRTWSLIKLPPGKKAVGSRWVYKTKFYSDGTLERHKARLVAHGFTQTFGIDYKETFASVAKMNTI
ncbi:hypothetical protein ACFX2C_014844 [Malus domestica]